MKWKEFINYKFEKEIAKKLKHFTIIVMAIFFIIGLTLGYSIGKQNNCEQYIESYNKALEHIDEVKQACPLMYEIPQMQKEGGKEAWKQNKYMKNPTLQQQI